MVNANWYITSEICLISLRNVWTNDNKGDLEGHKKIFYSSRHDGTSVDLWLIQIICCEKKIQYPVHFWWHVLHICTKLPLWINELANSYPRWLQEEEAWPFAPKISPFPPIDTFMLHLIMPHVTSSLWRCLDEIDPLDVRSNWYFLDKGAELYYAIHYELMEWWTIGGVAVIQWLGNCKLFELILSYGRSRGRSRRRSQYMWPSEGINQTPVWFPRIIFGPTHDFSSF